MSASTIQRLSQRVKSLDPVVKRSSRNLKSFSKKFLDLESENDKKQIDILRLSLQTASPSSKETSPQMMGEVYDLQNKVKKQSSIISDLVKENKVLKEEQSLAEKIISLLDANTLATALGAVGIAGVFGLPNIIDGGTDIGPGMTAEGGTKASPYIYSRYRTSGRPNHMGIDISGGPWQSGAPISVIKPGVVIDSDDLGNKGWGKFVVIKHDDGTHTLYGHLQSINVRKGQRIENKSGAATIIGKVGSTGRSEGPHLHFELGNGWTGGVLTGHRDPAPYIDQYVRAGGNVRTTQTPSIATAPSQSDASKLKPPQSPPPSTTGSVAPGKQKTSGSGQIVPIQTQPSSSQQSVTPNFTTLFQLVNTR